VDRTPAGAPGRGPAPLPPRTQRRRPPRRRRRSRRWSGTDHAETIGPASIGLASGLGQSSRGVPGAAGREALLECARPGATRGMTGATGPDQRAIGYARIRNSPHGTPDLRSTSPWTAASTTGRHRRRRDPPATRLMDEGGALLWGRVTYEMMEASGRRSRGRAPPAVRGGRWLSQASTWCRRRGRTPGHTTTSPATCAGRAS
jgi:hypothetical protein